MTSVKYPFPQNSDYGLFTPEEYKVRKAELVSARERTLKSIEEAESRRDVSFSHTERTFNFCVMLADRFLTGDVTMKRLILTTVGSNLTLKDKKLRIELLHPFQLIRSELQAQEALDTRLEPKNNEAVKGKTSTFVPVSPVLLPN